MSTTLRPPREKSTLPASAAEGAAAESLLNQPSPLVAAAELAASPAAALTTGTLTTDTPLSATIPALEAATVVVGGPDSAECAPPALRAPAPAGTTAPVNPLPAIYESFSPERLTWKNTDWIVVVWITAMHIGCLAAPFFFTWQALGVCLLLHWLTGSIGICLGYHRFLAHKSLKLASPVRFIAMLAGTLSGEGSPLTWAATHRLHHARSDQEGDPHSPFISGMWSHMYWLFVYRTPEERDRLFKRFAPDLMRDRMMLFFEKTYGLWLIGTGVALFAWGGWPMLLWGLCVRMVAMYHSTWFVNSATHIWGYRNYTTRDASRNLWWVAILAYGEGWHNNHHAHPHSARAGHKWWELDPTFWAIRTLQALGLAWNVDDRIPEVTDTVDPGIA